MHHNKKDLPAPDEVRPHNSKKKLTKKHLEQKLTHLKKKMKTWQTWNQYSLVNSMTEYYKKQIEKLEEKIANFH